MLLTLWLLAIAIVGYKLLRCRGKMKESDIKQLREVIAPMIPIGRVERLAAIGGLILIDLYALSQGINSGLTHAIAAILGGFAGFSFIKRNSKNSKPG